MIEPRAIRVAVVRKGPALVARNWIWLRTALDVAAKEVRHWRLFKLSPRDRLRLWRSGFLSEAQVLYDFEHAPNPDLFLSDSERYFRSGRINGDAEVILNDKLVFYLVMRSYTGRVAPVLGLISKGRFVPVEAPAAPVKGRIADILRGFGMRLVLKPQTGGGGGGILFYEYRDDSHFLNQRPVSTDVLEKRLSGEPYIACPVIQQAGYARDVFPGTVNTIRALTMWDYETERAFVAKAVHRFGAPSSGAVDNWTRGGVSAPIDLVSGVLGRGATFPTHGGLQWHDRHPHTGAQIEGLVVSHWATISEELVALAQQLPFLPYVGWDIIVTDDGFSIIEGNNCSDVNLIQIHGPLLQDERVRRFYERNRVLRRPR